MSARNHTRLEALNQVAITLCNPQANLQPHQDDDSRASEQRDGKGHQDPESPNRRQEECGDQQFVLRNLVQVVFQWSFSANASLLVPKCSRDQKEERCISIQLNFPKRRWFAPDKGENILDSKKNGCPKDKPRNTDGRQETCQQEPLEQLGDKHLCRRSALLNAIILQVEKVQLILVVLYR